jgi:DNA-3-methyladenine glycosylase
VKVARDLLGCEIIRKVGAKTLRARIVETEAYLEKDDPAAHCSRGPTPRAKVMFEEPGTIYVYFIYGMYFMLNFVTEKRGRAGAVLIRAVEPLEGIEKKTNGPAKLVLALGIGGSLNGKLLGLPHLAVARGKRVKPSDVVTTKRIGINVGKDLPLRFYVKGNPFVSRH